MSLNKKKKRKNVISLQNLVFFFEFFIFNEKKISFSKKFMLFGI